MDGRTLHPASGNGGWHPPVRPGLRPHTRLLRRSQLGAGAHATTDLLPVVENIWPSIGAGLTAKPLRDRSTRSTRDFVELTWAVSPATGIGLPTGPSSCEQGLIDATTDPDGCHEPTLPVAPGCRQQSHQMDAVEACHRCPVTPAPPPVVTYAAGWQRPRRHRVRKCRRRGGRGSPRGWWRRS